MYESSLQKVAERLAKTLKCDNLIQNTTDELRDLLKVDRVVLYYFYSQWKGQVTFESLNYSEFSIFGTRGADECFDGKYAGMYEAGRVRAISNIETEPIDECHRNFLRTIQVRANLVVPIVTEKGLWGLLIAHECRTARSWTEEDIEVMKKGATTLATAAAIRDS